MLDNQEHFNNEIIYLLNIRKPKLSDLKAKDIHRIISLKNGLVYLLDNIYELNCDDPEWWKERPIVIYDIDLMLELTNEIKRSLKQ